MSCLVIGVGNSDRGDDGAGPALVDRLAAERTSDRLHTACCQGDLTQLMELWSHHDDVVVADMVMMAGASPGEIHWFEAGVRALPYGVSCSSHSVSLAQAIELARTLDRLPKRLQVVGIVGADTSFGAALTAPVAAAVQRLARQLLEQLDSGVPRRA